MNLAANLGAVDHELNEDMNSRTHSARRLMTPAIAAATLVLSLASCKETSAPDGEFVIVPGTAEIFVGGDVQLTAIGAPAPPTWSSTNSQVATVVAETGWVIGVGRGQASIAAVAGSAVASIDVNVLQPPGLALSAPTVDFDMTVGGANPASQTVTVQNSGDGTLEGVRIQSITYGAGQPGGWLTVTSSSSVAPSTLTLSVSASGLSRGTYTAAVLVAADGVSNSPQILAVTFGVLAPAQIALSRTTVPMAGIPNATVNATVDVTNAGDRPLTGLTASILYPPGQPTGWLTATLDGATGPTTLRLVANSQNLPVGSYTTTVRVASTVGGIAPVDATVNFTVAPGPSIVLSQTSVPFQTATGQSPANQTVDVTNGGGGTLSGLSTGAIVYGGGQPTGWLSATLGSATAPTVITLAVSAASLPMGNYTATVPVLSGIASNSPLNLTVTLNIGPPPVIALNPSNVLFAGWQGAAALPNLQGVQVTNSAPGMGPLPGLSYSVQYSAGASGWLTASWQGGVTSAPTTLLLQPNTQNLPVAVYTAKITVSSSVPGVAPDTATVTYQVRSFELTIYPQITTAGCSGCHFGEFDGTADKVYNDLNARSDATLKCKLFTPFCHNGGQFLFLQNDLTSWMAAGRPR